MSILPGPKEQNLDEIQQFLHPIISDLLQLWRDGIVIPTESKKEGTYFINHNNIACRLKRAGHLIWVILVAIVCYKLATHKIGGFASHSHTKFCTPCWITLQDKNKDVAFQKDGAFLVSN